MLRSKIFPNYVQIYEYHKGEDYIMLDRKQSGKSIYKAPIIFDSADEAEKYFNEECGG